MLPGFLDEFFPEETRDPDTFSLHHYNGLVRTGAGHAAYIKGESPESDYEVQTSKLDDFIKDVSLVRVH